MNAAATVSVIVPCRNEHTTIAAFCADVLGQRLPAGTTIEVLIADGRSDDGTGALLVALAAADSRIVVIDNPGRIVSTGLNAALAAARGEVIVRMDVHTTYADDYVSECLAALAESGADNVGGPWRAVPDAAAGPTQRAVAAAFQSRWVAGGARSRQPDFNGWVDTVYLGCWPRAAFTRFGGFDETLVRNQDDEHNLRIRRGGGRVWQASAIRSAYRPRTTLTQVFRQWLQYGYWKPFVMRKHGQAAALRQLVPGLFVAAVGLAAAAAPIMPGPLLGLLALYGIAVGSLSAAVVHAGRLAPAVAWRVPAVIAAYHVGYGLGSLVGAWDVMRQRGSRPGFGRLTR